MSFGTISGSQLLYYMSYPDCRVIDLRMPNQYAMGHIAGAVNIPFEKLKTECQTLSKKNQYILYCQHGNVSMKAAKMMYEMEFNVVTLIGGYLSFCYRSR